MNKRYIDANALLEHECEADRMGAMLVVGKGYILSAPTADVAPVVRAEWEYLGFVGDKELWGCKACHGITGKVSPFCSNCGARMKGENI